MDFLKSIIESGLFARIIWTIIVIVVSIALYTAISKIFSRREKKNSKFFSSKKNKTYLRMLRNVIGGAIIILAFLTILQIFGINVSSMLAGVGIVSIVVGFALQDALKDFVRGFEIVSDNYYNVGDVIKFGDNVGEVLSLTLHTTKIQDINTMNIVSIANRNIDQVEVVSGYIYLPVPLPYEIKPAVADKLMEELTNRIAKLENVESATYQGLSQIADSVLNYQIAITCDPMNKLQVRRDSLGTVTKTLAEYKLRLPYQHIDVHQK